MIDRYVFVRFGLTYELPGRSAALLSLIGWIECSPSFLGSSQANQGSALVGE